MKIPQRERVLEYMEKNGSITQNDADRLRIKRLSARIYDLKKTGRNISTVIETGKNEYGPFTYARYKLEG